MTDHRSQSGRQPGAHTGPAGESAEATVRSLVQGYGTVPPYDAVEWNALATRVVGDAQSELKRRQIAAAAESNERTVDAADGIVLPFGLVRGGLASGTPTGTTGIRRFKRHWFDVTAGWVRPAMLAAAVVSCVAVTLAIESPVSPGAIASGDSAAALASASPSAYSAADQDASDSAMAAAVVGRASDRQVDLQLGPSTRDAMFTAVVEER